MALAFAAGARAAEPARDSARGQAVLQEMRNRRIVAADAAAWTSEDYTLLLRVREAERLRAVDLLRERLGTLKGYVVEQPVPEGYKKLWLTREGYGMFIFVKSQDARSYFESRGHEAKDVLLSLANLRGERLFDRYGTLTQAGDETYNRVKRGLPAFWRDRDGRVNGNVRPPRDGSLPPGETAAAPAPQSPQEAQALRKVAALTGTGYIEISESEALQLAQASGRSLEQLSQESSLQVVRAAEKTYYLLSPSDPLMTVVIRYRSGDRTRSKPAP